MRRFCGMLLAALLLLPCAACGGAGPAAEEDEPPVSPPESGEDPPETETPPDTAPAEDGEAGIRILVAYFSATGTTEAVARSIAETLGADLFAIVPAEPYTEADLDYSGDCRANDEQRDDSARPAIALDRVVEDWEDYDVVLLGHPIWWGIPPKIMRTFAEQYDWTGKTVAGFCTSGGSGYSSAGLPELTEGASWREGRRFAAGADAEDILAWAETLDLLSEEETDMAKLQVSFNGYTYTAALADNSSAAAFAALLEENGGSITVQARDYGGFEKVGPLPEALPKNDEAIDTVPGDLILYLGDQIVLYYDTNSWTFTRLGRLEGDLSDLAERLGEGDAAITYSLVS